MSDPEKAMRLTAKPNFDSYKIINEAITLIRMRKSYVSWNMPIAIGCCVLDGSKISMYSHHYDQVLPRYGAKAKLLFTDTDSLCYHIITPDIYADMRLHAHLYDCSDYPIDHPNYSVANAKVMMKFKDECNGHFVDEFVGLRSKMYSLLLANSEKQNQLQKEFPIFQEHIPTSS